MDTPTYDMIVVGAGPAGLSAARTAARLGFSVLVLERLAAPGDLAHPCGAMIAPVPNFVTCQRTDDGLVFPEIDLLIPSSMILGYPMTQRLVSPGGHEFVTSLSRTDEFPVAVVSKPAFLRMLAQQAADAGAQLEFGRAVIGLLLDGDRVVGVRTGDGEFRADVVLAGEGISRQLCDEAGLYPGVSPNKRYAFIVSQEFIAPAVRAEHLGQIVTLGRRYTSAREAFGTVVLPAPGRASVQFTIFADSPRNHTDRSLWYFVDEYIQNDPRVSPLFVGAKVINGAGHKMVLREAPEHVVSDGFMGIGDAITPGGHLGILPSIYLGRQAALTAAEALDTGDASAAALAPYEQMIRGPVLDSLETERKVILGLMRLSDDAIDRLCQTLHVMGLTAPFFGAWRTIAWETVGWFVKQFPLVARDWRLLEQVLQEPAAPWPAPETGPVTSPAAFGGKTLHR
jgi:electron transfer flavoprotein-quinone oxidoreductase